MAEGGLHALLKRFRERGDDEELELQLGRPPVRRRVEAGAVPEAGVRRLGLATAVGGADDADDGPPAAGEPVADGSDGQPAPVAAAAPPPPPPANPPTKFESIPPGRQHRAAPPQPRQLPAYRTTKWYVSQGQGKQPKGPYTADDLRDMHESGELADSSHVWDGAVCGAWTRLSQAGALHGYVTDGGEACPAEAMPEMDEADRAVAAECKQLVDEIAAARRGGAGKRRGRKEAPREQAKARHNTTVYVSSLPPNVTEAELVATFRKAGLIKEDVHTGKLRVKLYGANDARVTYVHPESVQLAIDLLDGTNLRPAEPGSDAAAMKVEVATFQEGAGASKSAESADAKRGSQKALWAKKKKLKERENARLRWNETDTDPYPRTVVIRNIVADADVAGGDSALAELRDEVAAEAIRFGSVERVKVFPQTRTVTVLFGSFIFAQQCIASFDGRYFGGRRLRAEMWDHSENLGAASAAPVADDGSDVCEESESDES